MIGGGSAAPDFAGWWSRVAAFLIDWLVLLISLGLLEVVFRIVDSSPVIIVLLVAWFLAAFLGYWVYFEGGESGQTPGKHALGIQVRSDKGRRASYGQAFGRNLLRVIMVIIWPLGIVNYLWPIWDSMKQCLHDKGASTVVVRRHP